MIGIYKVTNLVNQKKYIGQSTDIERRFKEHHTDPFEMTNPASRHIFYKAIRKYGIENFSFEILEECTAKELDEKEKYWIKHYNTYIGWENCQGYNMTIGGSGSGSRKIDPENVVLLWKQGYSIDEIINILDSSYTTIIKYLHQSNLAYVKINERKTLIAPCRSILQYSLSGDFIKCYETISDAVKDLIKNYPKVAVSNICQACEQKITTAYNYIWKYADDPTPISQLVEKAKQKIHHRNRVVNQYDLQGNFLKSFSTIKEAQLSIGAKSISSITNACTGRSKTSGGYIWKYKDQQ